MGFLWLPPVWGRQKRGPGGGGCHSEFVQDGYMVLVALAGCGPC